MWKNPSEKHHARNYTLLPIFSWFETEPTVTATKSHHLMPTLQVFRFYHRLCYVKSLSETEQNLMLGEFFSLVF